MLLNEHTTIALHRMTPTADRDRGSVASSEIVLELVPYDAHHVERYHAWMSDAAIRALTASEPLSIDEEYAMQASWRQDSDKLTFIVLGRRPAAHASNAVRDTHDDGVGSWQNGEVRRMIGDVNVFFSPVQSDDVDEDEIDGDAGDRGQTTADTTQEHDSYEGELELMIAEPSARRRGFGRLAVLAMMQYTLAHTDDILAAQLASGVERQRRLVSFTVKIGSTNTPSIRLFESLGFVERKYSAFFNEHELAIDVGDCQAAQDRIKRLLDELGVVFAETQSKRSSSADSSVRVMK